MLISCKALSVTQDQKPKDGARIRKKTGKWLDDKMSELLLKKNNINRQKAKWRIKSNMVGVEMAILVRKVALWVFFSFLQISFPWCCCIVFSIFKKDQKAGGSSTGKHTVGTESSTQMFCVSCIFRDICLCARLEKSKAVVNKFYKVRGGAWEKVSCEETNN